MFQPNRPVCAYRAAIANYALFHIKLLPVSTHLKSRQSLIQCNIITMFAFCCWVETDRQTPAQTATSNQKLFMIAFFLFALNAFYAGKSFYAAESTLQYNLRSCSLISWEALKFNDLYNVSMGECGLNGGREALGRMQMNLCYVPAAILV